MDQERLTKAMNQVITAIKQRRSVRQYDKRQISAGDLEAILEAGIFAPTAMNQQKWHFSVVQSKAALKRMVEITRENKLNSNVVMLAQKARDPNYHTYYGAPTVIIVSGEKNARFVEFDCAAAAQNIVLAAESLGIGSCIMTSAGFLFASQKGKAMKQELGIPDDYEHVCSIALGYDGAEKPVPPPRNREVFSHLK
jgi:nitroreductase